ncbi:MAG: anion permease [Negativicutes bacterium]|nr:anion permease [Negativicutes bacterium]
MSRKALYSLITVGMLVGIWFAPVPDGLKPQAWHLFAVFVATVFGFILSPVPNGVVALASLVIIVLTKTLSLPQVLAGAFGGTTVWLVVSSFLFAKGFTVTGLGRRVAYLITRTFGGSALGLIYSMAFADLVIGPTTPSNAARSGGVLFPIVRSLCEVFDSRPGPTARRIGSFMMFGVFQADLVVSAMFLTSCAPNPLIAELARKTLGVDISWTTWFLAALGPGIVALLGIPYLIYLLYPPELKKLPEAKKLAEAELKKLGPMNGKEKILLVVFVLCVTLWAAGEHFGIDATTVALLGILIMLLTNVLSWDHVTEEKKAWETLIWVGSVICIAGFLNTTGFIKWFANGVQVYLQGLNWIIAVVAVFAVYLYSHYGFASLVAHATAMAGALMVVAAAVGVPPFMAAFTVAIAANVCGCLSHFGTGPAAIYFSAGYVEQSTWWRLGFIISLAHIVIWLGVGSIWWKVLGLW